MTAAIFAATIAFVLALCLGVVIGRRTRDRDRSRGFAFLDRIPRRSASTAAEFVPEATLGPREVPASAEVRDSDVQATTDDGRMTKAGLLSMVVRNTETAIAVVDEFRDVVLYNQRAVELGLVREMLLADPVWEAVKEVLDTGVERRFEFSPPMSSLGFVSTGRTPRPSVEHVRCHARIVAQGEERYVVAYGLDDTEHKRVEATRRDFVANVSHELKTPLAAIQGFVETVQDDPDMPVAVRHRFLDKIARQTHRLATLVADLLTLSRLDDEGGMASNEPCDLAAVLRETVRDLASIAEKRDIDLQIHLPDAPMWVRADREGLRQIAGNLIDNALKYTPERGTVTVRLRSAGRRLRIEVADTGIGLSPADQERIFERFYRVDRARSRELGGTGLGLSIVKNTARNFGGDVGVNSELGVGSMFWVELPDERVAV